MRDVHDQNLMMHANATVNWVSKDKNIARYRKIVFNPATPEAPLRIRSAWHEPREHFRGEV